MNPTHDPQGDRGDSGRALRPRVDYATRMLVVARLGGLPAPTINYQFHPTRKFALDAAWPEQRVGVEVHGGIWTHGRHVRGAGFQRDRQKMNLAVLLGWRVLEFVAADLEDWPRVAGEIRLLLEDTP